MQTDVASRIGAHVRELWPRLSPQQRAWLQAHLVDPRVVELANDIEGGTTIRVWLVTDHTGHDDTSYRIIYDPDRDRFGYECTLANDRELFLGFVGTLADAFEGL